MVEFFKWVVEMFLATPVQAIALVLGAAGISLFAQLLKKWFKIENERWMFSVVLVITLLGSFLDWFLHSAQLPPAIVGIQTTILVGIAQPFYIYVVKPATMLINGYKANKAAIKEKLAQIEGAKLPEQLNTFEDAQSVVNDLEATALSIKTAPAAIEGAVAPEVRPVATF